MSPGPPGVVQADVFHALMSGAQPGAENGLWAHLLGSSQNSPLNRAAVLALSILFVLLCVLMLVVSIRFQHSKSVTRLGSRSKENHRGEIEMRIRNARAKDD